MSVSRNDRNSNSLSALALAGPQVEVSPYLSRLRTMTPYESNGEGRPRREKLRAPKTLLTCLDSAMSPSPRQSIESSHESQVRLLGESLDERKHHFHAAQCCQKRRRGFRDFVPWLVSLLLLLLLVVRETSRTVADRSSAAYWAATEFRKLSSSSFVGS